MKLTDFLQDVGRPVAYYPELRKITGSTNATILLCQFIYWRGKESDPNGWLYKTSDDIQNETGLSYGEQKTARRDLVEAGLLAEHYARLDHQMKFKLNLDTINDKWGKPQTDIPESGKPTLGNDAKPLSLNESETTTETTHNGEKSPDTSNLPIEWQIAAGAEQVTLPDQTDARRWDIAQLIGMGEKSAAIELAYAFMKARDILIPESKIKGQRKAVREMIEMGVQPEHVTEAVRQLLAKNMTVIDLFSVSKTAQDLANKKEVYTGERQSHAL